MKGNSIESCLKCCKNILMIRENYALFACKPDPCLIKMQSIIRIFILKLDEIKSTACVNLYKHLNNNQLVFFSSLSRNFKSPHEFLQIKNLRHRIESVAFSSIIVICYTKLLVLLLFYHVLIVL